ncbi:MAG: hypothetical protein H7831_04425 [Magnetococcus sp. WYHC-3]
MSDPRVIQQMLAHLNRDLQPWSQRYRERHPVLEPLDDMEGQRLWVDWHKVVLEGVPCKKPLPKDLSAFFIALEQEVPPPPPPPETFWTSDTTRAEIHQVLQPGGGVDRGMDRVSAQLRAEARRQGQEAKSLEPHLDAIETARENYRSAARSICDWYEQEFFRELPALTQGS